MFLNFLLLLFIPLSVLSHTVPGIGSIQKQLAARSTNPIDSIYDNLSREEFDFINNHLSNLTNATGSKCDRCKNKIRYGQTLLLEQPEKEHLISLLLFKYCLVNNNNTESKCDNKDFFITTNSKSFEISGDQYNSGYSGSSSINFYDNDFIHMLKNFNISSEMDLEYYCYYKDGGSCDLPETPDLNELYDIESWWPEKRPEHHSQPKYANNTEKFNVLHFTDFHIQLRYQVGSESNCSTPICCLPESYNGGLTTKNHNFTDYYYELDPSLKTFESSFYPDAHYDSNENYVKGEYYDLPKHRGYNYNSVPASTFGAYLCDSPEVLLNNTLKYISQSHKDKDFEFTLFTGDLVDHDVIHCDPDSTKTAEIKSFNIMKHYLNQTPVFPSLGNHDTFPYGQLSPINYDFNNSYDWNEELMSELWVSNGWLPKSEIGSLRSHYSGFSYVTDRNLKIISLNSNCYYQKNLWSYINLSQEPDSFGQWDFLIKELVESEKKNQRVWILAHIPAADADTLPIQSKIFSKIVERFSPYTIANIFYGHTHRDQFQILYSSNSSKEVEDVINMAWVAQSVTPLTDNNPSWRYYEVENESFNILNSYNYFTRLNETFVNGGNEPNWNFEYSVRDTYDPNHEWPEAAPLNGTFWHKFIFENLRNQSNIEFNQLYSNIQYRHSPNVPNCSNGTVVSDTCYNENYCDVANFLSDEYIKCLRDN